MKLTKSQRAQRGALIEAYAAAHPAEGYTAAVEWGAAKFRGILEQVRTEQRRPVAEQLAAMSAGQFEAEFSQRLAEVGSTAGLSSPYWAR